MKPKTHLIPAALVAALLLLCLATPAAAFSGAGSGTQSDPYIITTPAQLQEINNDLDGFYQLGNDIDLTSISWTPIGTESAPFNGYLDGNGYTISNLKLSNNILSGLFGWISGATIINTRLSNFEISNTDSYSESGFFCGRAIGCNFDSCIVEDSVIYGGRPVGGFVGLVYGGSLSITNSLIYNTNYYNYALDSSTYGNTIGGFATIYRQASATISQSVIIGGNFYKESNNNYMFGGLAVGGDIYSTPSITISQSCNLISSMDSSSYGGRIAQTYSGSGLTLSNNYASSSLSGYTPIGTTTKNGEDVSSTTYQTQTFWDDTLGWDFANTWYWDSTANLPKLQVFIKSVPPTISAITATPATGGQLTEYTLSAIATTEAEGGIASYQWSYSTDSGQTWQPISGANAATYVWQPGTTISGAVLIKCFITGADGGTVDSYVAGYTNIQITVVPPPDISTISVSRPLQKVNTPTTLTATLAESEPATYQWYYSTNGGTTWTPISGATALTAEYTPTTTGTHTVKIVVTNQYGESNELTLNFNVLPTYTPTPITNTSIDISIDSTAKYQGIKQFTLSSELKALNYYTPTLAYLAHDNALYYLESVEREVIPVSTTTGGTISAAYVGQNTGIITDTAGNTAFYSYQTNDWQYVEQNSASIIASTSSYAATVSGGTLRIYNLNGNLVASTATTAANLAGNDATNVFVSYNDKTLTYYWVNGNNISSASQTLTHSITELHQISGTNNFIISTTANTIIVEITNAGVYSLVATSETDNALIHTQATSINIFIGVSAPNEIFIIGADGETDGTYVTGSTLNDASIAKETGLYAVAGGADNQAYILSKSDSSVWQLQQVVSFGGTIDYSQISTTGTYAAVATGLKLYLLESKETSSSVYYLQGVVIGSTGKPYAGKSISINGDSIRTDTKGMFLYPVQPGNLVIITAGDTTVEYTPSSAALQQIAIRIKAGLLSTDVTYSADYNAESQAIIMSYDDAAGKTTVVNWKIYETTNNTLVATYTGNSASYPIEAGDVYNNYYVQLSADRGGATVTNTWSITPAGGQPIDLYGLDEDGRNIIFGFLLLLLAGLFGVMHSRSGAIIVALGACVMRYLELITIPWILITIAAVLAIVAAIAHGGQNR